MKLSELIIRAKLTVPSLRDAGLDDTSLTTLLNEACDEANLIARTYKGYTDFNITADTFIYNLSSIAPTFLGSDKRGLWIQDGDGTWQKIIPKTAKWLDKKFENWRSASSADIAQYYSIDVDELLIYPPIDEARSSGGRLYHLKKATAMGNGDHFPYSGSATELTALKPMDKAIISYIRYLLDPALGRKKDEISSYQVFLSECKIAASQIKRRNDVTSDDNYRMDVSDG